MKYFKVTEVVSDGTTLSIVTLPEETNYCYHRDGDNLYYGVDTEDENFLDRQYPECNVEELTYEEIKPILRFCKRYLDINCIVKKKIGERYGEKICINKMEFYDRSRELKLVNLGITDPENEEYLEYRNYVDECVAWGHQEKIKIGLEQDE